MLSFLLPNCASCESIYSICGNLCPYCWNQALLRSHGKLKVGSLNIHFLTEWVPDENRELSLLIEHLKGGKSKKSWEKIANIYLDQKWSDLLAAKDGRSPVLVPCPSKRPSLEDHAFQFARAIQGVSGLPMKSLLSHSRAESQRGLTRSARGRRQFHSVELDLKKSKPIFIDDIVTTGATARAARSALGEFGPMDVWCFAYRRLARNHAL